MRRKLVALVLRVQNDGSGDFGYAGGLSPSDVEELVSAYRQTHQYFKVKELSLVFVPEAPSVARGIKAINLKYGADDEESLTTVTDLLEQSLLSGSKTERTIVFATAVMQNRKVTVKPPDNNEWHELKSTISDLAYVEIRGTGGTASQYTGYVFAVWDLIFK